MFVAFDHLCLESHNQSGYSKFDEELFIDLNSIQYFCMNLSKRAKEESIRNRNSLKNLTCGVHVSFFYEEPMKEAQTVSYSVGSSVTFRQTLHTIERFIPVDKVPTKCKLPDLGSQYNLYIVRNVAQPSKSAYAWECELDMENRVEQVKEQAASV
jgi:hypothetical protein